MHNSNTTGVVVRSLGLAGFVFGFAGLMLFYVIPVWPFVYLRERCIKKNTKWAELGLTQQEVEDELRGRGE